MPRAVRGAAQRVHAVRSENNNRNMDMAAAAPACSPQHMFWPRFTGKKYDDTINLTAGFHGIDVPVRTTGSPRSSWAESSQGRVAVAARRRV